MRIIKQFTTRLLLNDMAELFTLDFDKMLLNRLKDQFNNVCNKSTYIINVLNIVRRSGILDKEKTLDSGLYVDITYTAECEVFETGEIIHCKIVKINNNSNILTAVTNNASVQVYNNSKVDIFKENDIIPVVIKLTRYPLYMSTIAIIGSLIVPFQLKDKNIYKVVENSNILEFKDDNTNILLNAIKELEKELSKQNPKAVKFFVDSLYPYTNKKLSEKNLKSMKDIENINIGDYIVIPDRYLNTGSFYVFNKSDDEYLEFELSIYEMKKHLLNEYRKDLSNLLGFITTYSLESIKTDSSLWKLMHSMKV